jgi:uroporphyrinogen-III synthase
MKMTKTHNILITRELSDDQLRFAERIRLNVTIEPAIKIEFRNEWLSVKTLLDKKENVVFAFTSQNGVRGFERYQKAGIEFPDVPVFAVGGKTADALSGIGFENIVTPDRQDGVGLAHIIVERFLKTPELKDATVLHFCGDRRRNELRHYLTELEITIKDIVVYKTELNEMNLPPEKFDAVLFYSPSAVQAYRNSGGFSNNKLPELFAIGNTTAEELSIESGKYVHVSPEPDTEVFLKFVGRVLDEQEPAKECPPSKGAMGDDPGMNLYYNQSLNDLARQLRNNSTKSEIRLWSELLQGRKTGHTFLRQRPVLNYIADFLCKDLKLIIELDGYSHEFEQTWKKDIQRQKELEKAGFTVIRFNDSDVMKDLRNVENEIMYWIEKLEKKSPPSKGESHA